MKIALAGRKDSTHISHFGRADFFRVYERLHGQFQLQEIRFNSAPCNGAGHDQNALEKSVDLVGDCSAVVASSIGPGALALLVARHIFPFEHEGAGALGIERALDVVHNRVAKSRQWVIDYQI